VKGGAILSGMEPPQGAELAGRRALVVSGHAPVGRAVAALLEERGAAVRLVEKGDGAWRDEVLGYDEVDLLVHDASALEEALTEEAPLYADGDLLQQACLGPMGARGFGRIVHVARTLPFDETIRARLLGGWLQPDPPLARRGPNFGRDGLRALVRGAALVAAPSGVTVNLVEVGALEAPGPDEKWREVLLRHTPRGRAASLREVAEAVGFLASPGASYVTGAVLPLCGGLGLGLFPEQYGASR